MDYFDSMRNAYKPQLTLDTPYMQNNQSKYLWLIDAGHGGLYNGHYTTKPKQVDGILWETKNFIFPDGLAIHEGVLNRTIATALHQALTKLNIDFALIYDEVEDTPLAQRVATADAVYRKDRRSILLSIHSDKLSLAKVPTPKINADFITSGKGTGCSVWTSKGQTKSDKIANLFFEVGQKTLPGMRFRSDRQDGDADMEADFYILRKTDCPAILCETGFYDNRVDADWLTSAKGQDEYVNYLLQSIITCEKLKPI